AGRQASGARYTHTPNERALRVAAGLDEDGIESQRLCCGLPLALGAEDCTDGNGVAQGGAPPHSSQKLRAL
ncbi:MAG: hypothetical protein ACPIOQ_31480, partial [Promethearchaeia archaeon]